METYNLSPIKFEHSQITRLNVNYIDGPLEPAQTRQVFIGNLGCKCSDETLRNYFAKYGDLVQCQANKGFGFITYTCSFMVDKLMKNRPHTVNDRKVNPIRAMSRSVKLFSRWR